MSTPASPCGWCGKPDECGCCVPSCQPFLDYFERRFGYDFRTIQGRPLLKRVHWRKQEIGLGVLRCPRDPENER